MPERIATLSNYNTLLNYMNRSALNYQNITAQLAAGSKVTSIIQDPIASVNIVNTNRQLGNIETYTQNVCMASKEISTLDELLSLAGGYLQEAWGKAMQANQQTYGHNSLIALKTEFEETLKTMVDLANTQYDNNYLFSGANTKTVTYTIAENGDIIYNGTPMENKDYIRTTEVANGVFETINTTGDRVFGYYQTVPEYAAVDGSSIYKDGDKYYYNTEFTANVDTLTPVPDKFGGQNIYTDNSGNFYTGPVMGEYYQHDVYTGNIADLTEIPAPAAGGAAMYEAPDGKKYGYFRGQYIEIVHNGTRTSNVNDLTAIPKLDADGNSLYEDAYGNSVIYNNANGGYEYVGHPEYTGDLVAVNETYEAKGIIGTLKTLCNAIQMVLDAQDAGESDEEGYALLNSTLDMFAQSHDDILNVQTKFGGIANRLEMSESTLETTEYNLTEYLSQVKDLDYAEAITKWLNAQYAYQASLQVSSQAMNLSLLNYL